MLNKDRYLDLFFFHFILMILIILLFEPDIHLFTNSSNLFYVNKSLKLETFVTKELRKVYNCLCANKLSLSAENYYVIFYSPQKC